MNFLVPQGIGDAIWAMLKIQDIAKKTVNPPYIDVYLNCSNINDSVESRSKEFVSRFTFVDKVKMAPTPIHPRGEPVVDDNGYYNYIPDGWHEGTIPYFDSTINERLYALMPNPVLERGNRIETWLPEYEINWNVMDDFVFTKKEVEEAEKFENFIVFYMGMLSSNTTDGHNRGPMWYPDDWIQLGDFLHEKLNTKIVLVGADYDLDYYEQKIRPRIPDDSHWINTIGQYSVPQVFAITRRARAMVSYQSGMGIVTSYLGVPLAIFWRPKGNSISKQLYISFEEKMNEVWANPDMIESGRHLPLVYGKHDMGYILDQIQSRGW